MDSPLVSGYVGASLLGVVVVTIWLLLLFVRNVCFWPISEVSAEIHWTLVDSLLSTQSGYLAISNIGVVWAPP